MAKYQVVRREAFMDVLRGSGPKRIIRYDVTRNGEIMATRPTRQQADEFVARCLAEDGGPEITSRAPVALPTSQRVMKPST